MDCGIGSLNSSTDTEGECPYLSGRLFVLLEEEVVVGVALDMDGLDAVVEERFEGLDVGLIRRRDEDAIVVQLRHPCAL